MSNEVPKKIIVEKNTSSINEKNDDEFNTKLVMLVKKKLESEGIEVNVQNVMISLKYVMELVELTEVKGKEQKLLVVRVMRKLINDTKLSQENKQLLISMIDGNVIDNVIEIIVDASKGNLDINKIQNVATNCCFGFFSK